MTDKRADEVPDRDFERMMRQGLQDLADEAPAYEPTRAAHEIPTRPGRSRPVALLAAAAVVVAVAAVALWTRTGNPDSNGDSGRDGAASCPSTLRVDGRSYVSAGDLQRIPIHGARVGTATLPGGCTDNIGTDLNGNTTGPDTEPDYTADAYLVPDVPASEAVMANGKVWVNATRTTPPAAVIEARTPQPCTFVEPTAVTGTLVAVHSRKPPRVDGDVRAPFTGALYSTDPALTAGRWEAVLVRFHVPAGGEVPSLGDMRKILYKAQPARVRLHCAAGYAADSVQLATDGQ